MKKIIKRTREKTTTKTENRSELHEKKGTANCLYFVSFSLMPFLKICVEKLLVHWIKLLMSYS